MLGCTCKGQLNLQFYWELFQGTLKEAVPTSLHLCESYIDLCLLLCRVSTSALTPRIKNGLRTYDENKIIHYECFDMLGKKDNWTFLDNNFITSHPV